MTMDTIAHLTSCGLPGVDRIPAGMHACHFYRDREDLLAATMPYITAGLRENQRCLWITAPPLPAREALEALRLAWPGADDCIQTGSVRMLDFDLWYMDAAALKTPDAINLWLDEERRALADGFSGLRIAANTSFVGAAEWQGFMRYEHAASTRFTHRRIVSLCSYGLAQWTNKQIGEVMEAHHCAFERQDPDWQVITVPPISGAPRAATFCASNGS